jgi:hypothetical protein
MSKKIAIVLVSLLSVSAFARTTQPLVECAMGGEWGNEGLYLVFKPIKDNPDAYWVDHYEVDPGGGLLYMKVFSFWERKGKAIEFSGGPLRMVLRTDLPRVTVNEEELTPADITTVSSYGRTVTIQSSKGEKEPAEQFLCRHQRF